MVEQTLYRAWRKAPFARIVLFFGTGLLLGFYFPLDRLYFWIAVGLSVCLFCLLLLTECLGKKPYRALFPVGFYLLLLLIGLLWMAQRLPAQQERYFAATEADYLIGVVSDEPLRTRTGLRFPLTVEDVVDQGKVRQASGQLLVYLASDGEEIAKSIGYGDKLLLPNRVRVISAAVNPNQFDYKGYLAHKNISYQANVSLAEVRIVGNDAANALVARALQLRRLLLTKFALYIRDQEALAICSALILGYRANFQEETLAAFVHTGTVHVLSVSGLHVGMVFYLLHFLLGFLDRFPGGRTIRFLLILMGIWGYVLLTGMAPAILRSGVMISFLLLARWSGRSHQNLNTLFASAICLLLFDPFMIFDMGFQLSYLAVFGLFTCYPLLNKLIRVRYKLLRLLLQALAVSLSAQLMTTPLVLYYFHQFPTYFLLGNLFVSIPTSALMYMGILLAVCPFSIVNTYVGDGLVYLCRLLL